MPSHAIQSPETRDPDYALLERVATGDRQALNELIHRHADAMWRVALRFSNGCAADAEDAIQEACLACLGSVHTFNKRGSVRSWILAITANEARDYQRKSIRRRHHEAQARASTPQPSPEHDDSALREAARTGLAELREPFRIILSLRYLDDLDDSTIAATLGVSEVTVRTRCHRALGLLRTTLGRRGFAVGTTALVAVLAPVHAAKIPQAVSQLVASACATGKASTLPLSVGSLGAPTSSLWFGIKIVAALVTAGAIAVGTTSLIPPETKPNAPQVVSSEPPPVTNPPSPVAHEILDQPVTIHLNNIDIDSALTLLRISTPLQKRPHFVIGFPTRFADFKKDPENAQHSLLPMVSPSDRDDEGLFVQVAVASESQSLRTTLDSLCSSADLRWWEKSGIIFIDKPVPPDRLHALEQAFHNEKDLPSARALAACTDRAALRILLLALANNELKDAAAKAIGEWIFKRTLPIFDRKATTNGQSRHLFKITDVYDRSILAHFTDDAEVTTAITQAIKQKSVTDSDGIYLAGQLQIINDLEQCIAMARQIPPADPAVKDDDQSVAINKEILFSLAALGWSQKTIAIVPLTEVMNNEQLDKEVRKVAATVLGYIQDQKAIDALLSAVNTCIDNRHYYTLPVTTIAEIDDHRVIPLLKKAFKDVDDLGYYYGAHGLWLNGSTEALTFLASMTKKKNIHQQRQANEALLYHEGEITINALYNYLKGKDHRWLKTREFSAYANIRNSTQLVDLLKRILLDDSLPASKYFSNSSGSAHYKAANALVAIDEKQAEQFLFENLPSKKSPGFSAFCYILAGKSERANNLILSLADDADPRINKIAIECLLALGQQGRDRLLQLLDNNTNEDVCLLAFEKINTWEKQPDGSLALPVPDSFWKKSLVHRFEGIRKKAANYIAERSDNFEKELWLELIDDILQSDELRQGVTSIYAVLDNLYKRDPARWRSAIALYSNDSDKDVRVYFWQVVTDSFDDIPRISRDILPRVDRRVIKSKTDKILLLNAAATAMKNDKDPHVRARAGWTLAVALNYKETLTFDEHEDLTTQLQLCAQNESDPESKKWLGLATKIKPYVTDDDKDKARYGFKWPKKQPDKKPGNEPPKPQSADDF